MIQISDRHRDDILRFLELFMEQCKDSRSTKVRDAVRRAKLLHRDLSRKQPFTLRKEQILKKLTLF